MALPRRFRPYARQAETQAAIRYGGQEDALQSIFDTLTRDYGRQSTAQRDMGMSLLGSLNHAGQNLTQVYSDAGLTPEVLATIGESPTGQRIAAELARGQAGIQEQRTGALAGQQYIQQRLADDYREDVGQINRQATSMAKERGLYESSLLDELIGEDRARRSEINAAARKQQFDAEQNILDREASQGNALIGQGLIADEQGNLLPLPGGKADPNAPANKPKRPRVTADAQKTAGTAFSNAFSLAGGMVKGKPKTPKVRQGVTNILASGREASGGEPVYDVVEDPYTKKKTNRRRIDPDTNTQVTTPKKQGVPKFDRPIAEAATEQAMFGYVTTKTVRNLQKLGYSVRQIPGLVTENQYRKTRPRQKASVVRPNPDQR